MTKKSKQIFTKTRDFSCIGRENYRETVPYLEQPGHNCQHLRLEEQHKLQKQLFP